MDLLPVLTSLSLQKMEKPLAKATSPHQDTPPDASALTSG
jgi:hypothetical protein